MEGEDISQPGSCSPSNESVFRSVIVSLRKRAAEAVHGDLGKDNQSPNDGTGRAIRAVPTKGVHVYGYRLRDRDNCSLSWSDVVDRERRSGDEPFSPKSSLTADKELL